MSDDEKYVDARPGADNAIYVSTVSVRKMGTESTGVQSTVSWEMLEQLLRDAGYIKEHERVSAMQASFVGITIKFGDNVPEKVE